MSVTLLQAKPIAKRKALFLDHSEIQQDVAKKNNTNSQILTNPTQFENDHDTKLCDDCEADYKEEDEARHYYTQVNGILYYKV